MPLKYLTEQSGLNSENQYLKMKRLWKNNPNSDSDLTDRREAEAKLIESCG